MDICFRLLKESNKVGSIATVSGTMYCSYPILPFGIVVCTFFPTTFLDLAVYEQLWAVTRTRLTLLWSCPWKVSTIRDSLLIVYCLKISLLYEWLNKQNAILFSLHFERLHQRKMANFHPPSSTSCKYFLCKNYRKLPLISLLFIALSTWRQKVHPVISPPLVCIEMNSIFCDVLKLKAPSKFKTYFDQ